MRIAGTNIPDNKKADISLGYIYGIGNSLAGKILNELEISANKKIKDLTAGESNALREAVLKYRIEGELRREISGNVKRLKDIKSYRGVRHLKRLPVRGQRTKSNTRTVRGNVRVTMGSGRRKLEKT